MDPKDIFGDEDLKNLKVGECMEMSMNVSGHGESVEGMKILACRTKKDTIKMKMKIPDEEDVEFTMEMGKRKMHKEGFGK